MTDTLPAPFDLAACAAAAARATAANDVASAKRLWLQVVAHDPQHRPAWEALATLTTGAQHAMCVRWLGNDAQAAPHPHAVRPPAARRPATTPRRRSHWRWQMAAGLGLIALSWAGHGVYSHTRLLPRITVGGVQIGGLTPTVARARLQAAQLTADRAVITLAGAGWRWQVPRAALFVHDAAALDAAWQVGRTGDWLARERTRLAHLLGTTTTLPGQMLNPVAVDGLVATLAQRLSRPAYDAAVVRTPFGYAASTAVAGRAVDRVALRQSIIAALAQETPAPVAIPVRAVAPTRTAGFLQPAIAQLNALQRQPLTLTVGDQSWPVDRTSLTRLAPSGVIEADTTAMTQLVTALHRTTLQPPVPSRIAWRGDRVGALQLAQPGAMIDQAAAHDLIRTAIFASDASVALPLLATPAPAGDAERLGLLTELGRGESQFVTYSAPNRDANVLAGGQELDGLLIPPGGDFSFLRTIGDIEEREGYQWGEMIENGQVTPALGGGICQVSTTVFRAALLSGLPIVERHPHSWRLPWYEVESLPGLDATIALGGPDLRFRNDTGGYLLLRVETDLARKRQTVIVYGTPTGRSVEVTAGTTGGIVIERRLWQAGQLIDQQAWASVYTR